MVSNPRRLSYREREREWERINAALRQRIAELEAPPPAPMVALKLAAYNAGIRPERLRRWCIAGLVDAELIGHQWMVSEASLADYMRRIGLVVCPRQSKTAAGSRVE